MLALFTNHPKHGDVASFNQALCGLCAAGLGYRASAGPPPPLDRPPTPRRYRADRADRAPVRRTRPALRRRPLRAIGLQCPLAVRRRARRRASRRRLPAPSRSSSPAPRWGCPASSGSSTTRTSRGSSTASSSSTRSRTGCAARWWTSTSPGWSSASPATRRSRPSTTRPTSSSSPAGTRRSTWSSEFGIDAARDEALDAATRLAIGAGFDALRDAGIPLVMRYKTTTLGTRLPERWGLPDALRDDTGVIFASAFPGLRQVRRGPGGLLHRPRAGASSCSPSRPSAPGCAATSRPPPRSTAASPSCATCSTTEPFLFDRRFLFRVLSMGHSQFAEIIGARGPNTQINAACASTTQALGARRGLDPRRSLPPGDRRVRRRRHQRRADAVDRLRLPGLRRGRHRRRRRGGGHAVRPPPARHDHRHGRRGVRRRVGRGRPRARHAARSARCSARSPPTARSTAPAWTSTTSARSWSSCCRQAEARGVDRHAIARLDRLRLARDLHAGARGQRGRRDQRAAQRLRRPGRLRGHHQHQGLHRPRHGRWHRGRRRDQGARDRGRPARAQLQGARPGARAGSTCRRRRLPGRLRAAAGGRFRLPDRHVAAALDPDARRPAPLAERARLRLPDRRRGRWQRWLARISARPGSRLEVSPGGCGSSTGGAGGRAGRRRIRRSRAAVAAPVAGRSVAPAPVRGRAGTRP